MARAKAAFIDTEDRGTTMELDPGTMRTWNNAWLGGRQGGPLEEPSELALKVVLVSPARPEWPDREDPGSA